MDTQKINIDVVPTLKKMLPALFKIIGDNQFNWTVINGIVEKDFIKKMNQQILLQKQTNDKSNKLKIESSIYDIIVHTIKGDADAIRLTEYFNSLLEELDNLLPEDKKKILITTLKGILTNTDKNYRNYIGELSVLNNFLKSDFRLLKLEALLPNKKKIDFEFCSNETGEIFLIEVVNIHYNNEKEYTEQLLSAEIKGKLTAKINDKGKNENKVKFYLIPVIWATYDQIKMINNLLDKILTGDKSILQPMAFCAYSDEKGRNVYKFDILSNLLVNST